MTIRIARNDAEPASYRVVLVARKQASMAFAHCITLAVVSSCFVCYASLVGKNRTEKHLESFWDLYKTHHHKKYSAIEERHRRRNWEANVRRILSHNAAKRHSFSLEENHLADLTERQYLSLYANAVNSFPGTGTGRERKCCSMRGFRAEERSDDNSIPSSVDWRDRGYRVPVWNQEGCGACYAFSVVASLQAQYQRRHGVLEDLSEQQILDCSQPYGNIGCQGGSLRATMRYVEAAGGLMAERDYPYEGQAGPCRFERWRTVLNVSNFEALPAGDEAALARAVATVGPVAVTINARPHTFRFYHSGVYDDPDCVSSSVNHAVLVVGFTPSEWIIKNWWSERWGEGGYMRLRRGDNRCGIANLAVLANIADPAPAPAPPTADSGHQVTRAKYT